MTGLLNAPRTEADPVVPQSPRTEPRTRLGRQVFLGSNPGWVTRADILAIEAEAQRSPEGTELYGDGKHEPALCEGRDHCTCPCRYCGHHVPAPEGTPEPPSLDVERFKEAWKRAERKTMARGFPVTPYDVIEEYAAPSSPTDRGGTR